MDKVSFSTKISVKKKYLLLIYLLALGRAYIFRVFFYDTTLHNFYNDDITAQN